MTGRRCAGLGSPSWRDRCSPIERPGFPENWGWVGRVLPLAAVREWTVLAFTCDITLGKASGKNNRNDPDRGRSYYPSSGGLREGV